MRAAQPDIGTACVTIYTYWLEDYVLRLQQEAAGSCNILFAPELLHRYTVRYKQNKSSCK